MRFTHAYRDTFRPEEVLVALTQSTQNPLYDGLGDKIRLMAGACGFLERGASDLLTLPRTFKIKHSIILDEGDQIRWILGKHLAHLDHFDSISLGTVYSSQEAMAGARETIDLLKGKFGDRVNFLRPDEACPATGEHYVSHQKIVDNAVCDSVRIKYRPHRIAQDIQGIVAAMAPFFKACSRTFQRHRLYHRSPTDGFFAIRCQGGFLITATKTDKGTMDMERVALVHGYDEGTNTITFSGPFLPSSDVVEAALTLAENPRIDALIHTHASTLFTRNPHYARRRLVPKLPYGEPLLGHRIATVIGDHLNNFIILEDHGEFFNFSMAGDLTRPAAQVEAFAAESLRVAESLLSTP